MSLYEIYHVPCPACGYPEGRDHGPYIHGPRLGVPPDRGVHVVVCGRCGGRFDAVLEVEGQMDLFGDGAL